MADDTSYQRVGLDDVTTQALGYAAEGMHVFPVRADTKAPLPGYAWLTMASTQASEVAKDFTIAIMAWGADMVSIAWALGVDGCMAVDIDAQPEPPWIPEIEKFGAHAKTRKGRHLYFKNPQGVVPGNGISGFPTHQGFDVRGAGGYVVIAGPDRPGLTIEQYERMQAFPRADWLTSYGGSTNSATPAEVREFAAKHTASRGDQYLNWLRTAIETQWQPGNEGDPTAGRHPLACEWMAKVAEESQVGMYSFTEAALIVKRWWQSVTPSERHGREWNGILSWAVGRALSHPPTESDAGDEPESLLGDNSSPFIDWSEFWTDDQGEHEWMIEGFWPAGRSVLLHAPAKTGKSLYSLWCAVCLAIGVDLATGEQFEPRIVMYVDYEMSPADLQERLNDFGVTPGTDLSRLFYSQRPMDFTSLDTAAGASIALGWVDQFKPEALILDTFSRCVDGDENEADTVRAFYRHTGRPLRDRGIPYLRVDHTGKDSSKGARGSSAKADDVDLIWSMQQTQSGFQLKSRSRVSWVPAVLNIDRTVTANQITFSRSAEITELVMDEATTAKVYEMEELGIDPMLGRDQVIKLMLEAGHKPGRASILSAAIRWRRDAVARGVVVRRP